MGQSISQKRPWLAAVLTALLTGLGHLYLRRWRRAVGWVVVSVGVSALFVDPSAAAELRNGSIHASSVVAVFPGLLVVGLSIIDAYLLARAQNDTTASSEHSEDGNSVCPHCRRELDPDLDFCHWCTRSVDDIESMQDDPSPKEE